VTTIKLQGPLKFLCWRYDICVFLRLLASSVESALPGEVSVSSIGDVAGSVQVDVEELTVGTGSGALLFIGKSNFFG